MKKFLKYILIYFCFILSISSPISLADEIDYLDDGKTLNISSVFSNVDNLSAINSKAYVVF